ncbi:hypothetical protein DFJ77DRAFT_60956 [Powellomyces hirtus]|nr:hypothetical protein DFJ77DRAFT_60956 [Powellomyces hirtus]
MGGQSLYRIKTFPSVRITIDTPSFPSPSLTCGRLAHSTTQPLNGLTTSNNNKQKILDTPPSCLPSRLALLTLSENPHQSSFSYTPKTMALSVDPPSSRSPSSPLSASLPPPPSPATSPPAINVDLPLDFTAKEALAAQALLFAQHSPSPPPPPRPSHPCFSSSFADILAAAAAAAAVEAKADAEADAAAVHTASSCAPPPSPPSPIIIKTEPCDDASARAAAAMLVEACEFLDHPYAPSSAATGTTNVDCKREDGRIYACENDACGKTFMQLAHLRIHQQTQSCPASCALQRKHTGERPYICMYPGCTRSFTQLGNLKTHERKHTGEKPYKCSFLGCDKSFSQMGNMKTHELLHLGFKPYTCGIDGCDRAFSQLGNLKVRQCPSHPLAFPNHTESCRR